MFRKRSGRPRSWTRAASDRLIAPQRADLGHPGQLAVAGQLGAGGQQRRRARQAAEEQVPGDVRGLPDRLLDHRPAVVGGELRLRHHRLLGPAACGRRRAAVGAVRSAVARPAVIGSLTAAAEAERDAGGGQPGRGQADVLPHARQVPGGDHRVRRQPVHLGLVEQQEERPAAADAVVRVVASRAAPRSCPAACSCASRLRGPLAQLVQRAELDRVGRARLGAGGLHAGAEPVVAQRALPAPGRPPRAGRSPRTGRPGRSSRSRCRCPPGRPRCRTRSGTARRSGTRPGRPRACSACTRRGHQPAQPPVRHAAPSASTAGLPTGRAAR